MLAHCKIVDVSVCASQAAARKAQPLWQQLGFQAKINERKKIIIQHPQIIFQIQCFGNPPQGWIVTF